LVVGRVQRLSLPGTTYAFPLRDLEPGQSKTNPAHSGDDILIDVRKHWYGMSLEDDGRALRARPGTMLGHAAKYLGMQGDGSDPTRRASTRRPPAASSPTTPGMRCTLERNSYNTVRSDDLRAALWDCHRHGGPDAEATFAAAEPELADGLMELRQELLADEELAARIRRKFSIRNTNGYRLDALLDGETPLEIFRRLVVGSDGTRAFMAEVVIDTLHKPAKSSVIWIVVPSLWHRRRPRAPASRAGALGNPRPGGRV